MDEKKWKIRWWATIVGCVANLISVIVTIVGSNKYFLAMGVAFAGIATICFVTKTGVEIAYKEKCGISIGLVCICLFNAVVDFIRLVG